MLNCVLKFPGRGSILELAPTDNVLEYYGSYINTLIRTLEFHAQKAVQERAYQDTNVLREAIIRISYAGLIFDALLQQDSDAISQDYDFSAQMQKIIDLSKDTVEKTIGTTISIAMVVEINDLARTIVENYHFNQVKRPWWMFWR